MSVGDLGANLSQLNIFRKYKKVAISDSDGAAAAANLARMFPTTMQVPMGEPDADRATTFSDNVVAGRPPVAAAASAPELTQPKKRLAPTKSAAQLAQEAAVRHEFPSNPSNHCTATLVL